MAENKCGKCIACCKYTMIQIPKPKTKGDYSDILWYLYHENTNVMVERKSGKWQVISYNRCKNLDDKIGCKNIQ